MELYKESSPEVVDEFIDLWWVVKSPLLTLFHDTGEKEKVVHAADIAHIFPLILVLTLHPLSSWGTENSSLYDPFLFVFLDTRYPAFNWFSSWLQTYIKLFCLQNVHCQLDFSLYFDINSNLFRQENCHWLSFSIITTLKKLIILICQTFHCLLHFYFSLISFFALWLVPICSINKHTDQTLQICMRSLD